MRRLTSLTALTALLSGCGAGPAPAPAQLAVPPGAQQAVVVRHTDGDTFWLRGTGSGPLPGRPTKVRLLGVDTPEVFGIPGCYGEQASRRTAGLLPVGARVRVTADRQGRDRYDRLLLYVWTASGDSLQEALLRDGYARALPVRPNVVHQALFAGLERQARLGRRGLWGAC